MRRSHHLAGLSGAMMAAAVVAYSRGDVGMFVLFTVSAVVIAVCVDYVADYETKGEG